MSMNFDFIKENKKAIWFLLVFVGLYLVLNTVYGFFIQYYYPSSDPFTRLVTSQVVWFLSWFDSSIHFSPSSFVKNIAVANGQKVIIYVYEGCNGINVMIVYLCFLAAFRGSSTLFFKFLTVGVACIHALNLARVGLLYAVAIYFPGQLYFFHKFFFTGIIYVAVFVLWFYWVRSVKHE